MSTLQPDWDGIFFILYAEFWKHDRIIQQAWTLINYSINGANNAISSHIVSDRKINRCYKKIQRQYVKLSSKTDIYELVTSG